LSEAPIDDRTGWRDQWLQVRLVHLESHTARMPGAVGIPMRSRWSLLTRTPDLLFAVREKRPTGVLSDQSPGGRRCGATCPHVRGKTHLPVLGVPVQSYMLSGVRLAAVPSFRMPAGVPVATLAIGKGRAAINAAVVCQGCQ